MKSIKPGRGPSAMGAVGSIVGIVFGILWTAIAFSITAPTPFAFPTGAPAPFPLVHVVFPLFGVVFIGIGIANLVYNTVNATGKNRMSAFDITDDQEEPDPLEAIVRGPRVEKPGAQAAAPTAFCPYCGAGLKQGFKFCPACGKSLGE